MPQEDFLSLIKEGREGHEKFHQHWSFLAGGTLTLVIGFLSTLKQIDNLEVVLCFKYALFFICASLILSPLRNLLSVLMVNMMSQQVSSGKFSIKKAYTLRYIANIFALLSVTLYIFGMVLLIQASNILFL